MTDGSDEDLLAAIGVDPGALPAFYLRHIAKVTGMGVRRFDQPEDVADFVANVFLEVLRSAGGFDPGRGTCRGLAVWTGKQRRSGHVPPASARSPGRAAAEGPRALGRG